MELLIITGACGVGKSTTAVAWAKSKNGAIIECDFLTEWIYNKNFKRWKEEEEELTANMSGLMAVEYMKAGMPVAIENVWTPKGIQILLDKVKTYPEPLKIKVIWLTCAIAENHRRDELRIKENQMLERVDVVNEELRGYQWPDFVHHLDTTNVPVEAVLSIINDLDFIIGGTN